MPENDNPWVTHSQEELQFLIEREINTRLKMSSAEFNAKRAARTLPDVVAVRDIEMLMALLEQPEN